MKKSLVIVESPAKSRTLSKFLGDGYDITSSMGHIIDLPASGMGVDIENGFKPKYTVLPVRKKIMQELKAKAKGKRVIYLATDPDREGEAISWHLERELVSPDQKSFRVEFHEITRQAIEQAFKNPRCIDINKVNAQQARRILDRVVGYNLSPLLWQKVGRGLSAGRVQSVALRLIVEREQEINSFKSQEYWELEALLKKKDPSSEIFKAKLVRIDGEKPDIKDEQTAQDIVGRISKSLFSVLSIKEQKKARRPLPAYTTSTMQQEAFNKLRFSAARTMRVAQQLYEGLEFGQGEPAGLITYIRTDSIYVSKEARDKAKEYIEKKFGKEYLPKHTVKFKKSGQKTQEAHEAIRPTSVDVLPDDIKEHLTTEQFKLYELIWRRFLQSQMAEAVFNTQAVDISAQGPGSGQCLFRSSVSNMIFDGFLKLETAKQKDAEKTDENPVNMPRLLKDEALDMVRLMPSQHFTKPPSRYSEASLIKELEEKGIGRPSTYAPTISTIADRHYLERKAGYLYPTEVGTVVTGLLVEHFPDILNVSFTAQMETDLDQVELGKTDWVKLLSDFYTPFSKDLSEAQAKMKDMKKEKVITEYKCQLCGKPMVFRWSRRGTFLGCSGFPRCKNSRPARKTADGRIELIESETVDILCDKCGKPMMVKHYSKGRFLSCSDYPKCRNTKPFPTGVKCPQPGCEGELVERSSRRGPFFGCSKYPDCKYTCRKLPDK